MGLRLLGGSPRSSRPRCSSSFSAPEAYLPLQAPRDANFHASADGDQGGSEQVFAVLERPAPASGHAACDLPGPARCSALAVEGLGGDLSRSPTSAALQEVSFIGGRRARCWRSPGPSGCGKSTLLGVLLGLVTPDGRLGSRRRDRPRAELRARCLAVARWRGCRSGPHLFAASDRRQRPASGGRDATDEEVRQATADAGCGGRGRPASPRAWTTRPRRTAARGTLGGRASTSCARHERSSATPRSSLLDEPTANLDGQTGGGRALDPFAG